MGKAIINKDLASALLEAEVDDIDDIEKELAEYDEALGNDSPEAKVESKNNSPAQNEQVNTADAPPLDDVLMMK